MEILKVSSKSNPSKVAGAMAGIFRDGKNELEIHTIGAGSLNQGVKAVAIARGFVAPSGKNLVIIPAFNEEGNICQVVTNLTMKYPQYDYVIVNFSF